MFLHLMEIKNVPEKEKSYITQKALIFRGKREEGRGNREQGTGNREQGTGNFLTGKTHV